MYKPASPKHWQGREDKAEHIPSWRWHQKIKIVDAAAALADLQGATSLIGFACDEGVRRNQGRVGATEGPNAIRSALKNLSYHSKKSCFDFGNIICEGKALDAAQAELGEMVAKVLSQRGNPVVLGGGHEMAWGSFLGIKKFLNTHNNNYSFGIINFDAHFDLRTPNTEPNSGTPFHQIAEDMGQQNFHYYVVGINPSSNNTSLFRYAETTKTQWAEDVECNWSKLPELTQNLEEFIAPLDYLYLSICMDVFPAAYAPGVSAPAALGIEPTLFFSLLAKIQEDCRTHNTQLLLVDIAETNPHFDRADQTAKLAARIVTSID